MPSTFDPLLRLELQASGENQSTWGTKTNNNLELLAEAIAGHVSVDALGSGDLTLSISNATTDQSRRAFITLSGILTGNRNIIIPSASKTYVFRDNTTGSGAITIKTAAGTGAVIVRGGISHVVCDGTETYLVEDATKLQTSGGVITGSLGVGTNVSIAGTLSVSGTGSFTGNVIVGNDLVVTADLSVEGNAEIAGAVSIGGALVVTGGIQVASAGVSTTGNVIGVDLKSTNAIHTTFGYVSQPTYSGTGLGAGIRFSISTITGQQAIQYDVNSDNTFTYLVTGVNVFRLASLSDGVGPYLEYLDTAANAFGARSFVSDAKLKTNIVDSHDKHLDYVLSVKIRQFDWAPSSGLVGTVNAGFVAQELMKVDPQFVSNISNTYHLNLDVMLARTMGAVQELDEKIKKLEQHIRELECKTNF